MVRRRVLFVFMTMVIAGHGSAQDLTEGVRTDLNTGETSPIYYSNNSYNIGNIYYSSYAIFLNPGNDTAYSTDLIFDTFKDSIYIKQYDLLLDQTQSRSLKFYALPYQIKPSDAKPYYCVKNYRLHDTTITLTDSVREILFTIADTVSPKLFLNQIISPDGNYLYSLIKLRGVYLNPHLLHARDYWEWFVSDSLRRSSQLARYSALQAAVAAESKKIRDDKDSLIRKLTELKQIIQLTPYLADENMQQIFDRRMDTICLGYFGRTCNYDISATLTYKVYSSLNHQTPNEIYPYLNPDSLKLFWFRSRMDSVETWIKRFAFENKKVPVSSEDPINLIDSLHLTRSTELAKEIDELNLSNDSLFADVMQSVKDDPDIQEFGNLEVEVTTIYNYTMDYKSTTENRLWIYYKNELKDREDSIIIRKENNDSFFRTFPNPKNGKYSVRLNTAVLNDSIFGPDLFHAQIKYKYVTHIGFNIGTFMAKGDLVEGQETHDGKLLYWNAFLIYHHFGVFGGKGLEENSLISNYYEGGFYIAPGNIFYFKLGLGKYNGGDFSNKIMPIIGGSLIFPVFQMEGGYNFALKYPYVMIGLNVPLNY